MKAILSQCYASRPKRSHERALISALTIRRSANPWLPWPVRTRLHRAQVYGLRWRLVSRPPHPVDQFGDPYRVFNFIARYGGHRLHPVLRRVRVGVTCQQFKCVARGFTIQVHVVVEQARQLDRLRDR